MSYVAISRAVSARLLTEPGITALAGQRIRPDGIDQGEAFPAITYVRRTAGYIPGINGGDEFPSPQFEITCWAEGRDESESLADAVLSALEDDGVSTWSPSSGDVTVTAATFLDSRWVAADDPDGGDKMIYGVAMVFEFQFQRV